MVGDLCKIEIKERAPLWIVLMWVGSDQYVNFIGHLKMLVDLIFT